VFYCNNLVDAFNLVRIQAKKGIKSYYKTNTTTTLEKHVDVNHVVIVKKFEEISLLKGVLERQLTKKDIMCLTLQYQKSWCKRSFQK
jgi:hypothetical protein